MCPDGESEHEDNLSVTEISPFSSLYKILKETELTCGFPMASHLE